MTAIKRVAIAGNVEKMDHHGMAEYIIQSFIKNGFETYSVSPIKYKSLAFFDIEEINPSNTDLLCILGGDGTIIGIIRSLPKQIPLIGINVGSRGVLTEIFPDELEMAIDAIKNDRFSIQERMMIKLNVRDSFRSTALNEAFIYRSSMTRLPLFSIAQKDLFIKKKMDGLILSTPTGSTGHSFSLDGPVVDETLDVFLLNPIGSIQRLPPMILQPLPTKISCSNRATLVVDGQIKHNLMRDEVVEIEKNEEKAKLLKIFTGRLCQLEKLGFNIIG
ncbi:MAG: NAD(+)/NADH kinase [Nitrososphaeria archaeon]